MLSPEKVVIDLASELNEEADLGPTQTGLFLTICLYVNWIITDCNLSNNQKEKLLGVSAKTLLKCIVDEYTGRSAQKQSSGSVNVSHALLFLTELKVLYFLERKKSKVLYVPEIQPEVTDVPVEGERKVDFEAILLMMKSAMENFDGSDDEEDTTNNEPNFASDLRYCERWVDIRIGGVERDYELSAQDKKFILNDEVYYWKLHLENRVKTVTADNFLSIYNDYTALCDTIHEFGDSISQERSAAKKVYIDAKEKQAMEDMLLQNQQLHQQQLQQLDLDHQHQLDQIQLKKEQKLQQMRLEHQQRQLRLNSLPSANHQLHCCTVM